MVIGLPTTYDLINFESFVLFFLFAAVSVSTMQYLILTILRQRRKRRKFSFSFTSIELRACTYIYTHAREHNAKRKETKQKTNLDECRTLTRIKQTKFNIQFANVIKIILIFAN